MRISAGRVRLATGLFRQVFISFLGLVVGLLIVRIVPSRTYAYYTIVVSAISGCAVVADSGAGFALLSLGGRFWGNAPQVASVLKSVIRCIRLTWPISVLGFAIWVTVALFRNGFSGGQVAVALLVLAGNSFVGLRAKLWDTLLRLDERQSIIQSTQLLEVSARLALIIIFAAAGFMKSFGALAVISAGQGFSYLRLMIASRRNLGIQGLGVGGFGPFKQVRDLMLRQLPNSLFFAVQGQLSVGLLSLLSNADHVAEFGALSRFSAASSVIQAFAGLYLVPRFARLTGGWCSNFWRSIALVASLAMVVPILSLLIPHLMLELLGPAYSDLISELRLLAFADMTTCILAVAWALLASRGNNYFTWLFVPINLLAQAIGIVTLKVDTISGVILLNFLSSGSLIVILSLEYRRSLRVENSDTTTEL